MSIRYIERSTKQEKIERVYGHRALSLFYGDSFFSRLFSFVFLPLLSRLSFVSRLYGKLQKMPRSVKKIAPFIASYGIDVSEFEHTSFTSFNDFFIRKLKTQARPIVKEKTQAALPADGRYLVFPKIGLLDNFYVKGVPFNLRSFLDNDAYARRYAEGSMLIARLCPSDYHRFHFIADGIPSASKKIGGYFYSVNPIALKRNFSIFWRNKREITEFETDLFGKVLYVEIGATCVGTIHQTYTVGKKVAKGAEKGFFSFGGSCVVVLFEKETILFDSDLLINSAKGIETRANFGESLGRAAR